MRLNAWFPWVLDGGEEFLELIPSWRQEREPFLPKTEDPVHLLGPRGRES